MTGSLGSGSRPRRDVVGLSLTWLSGGALALQILLVVGLLALLAWYGLAYLWPDRLVEYRLADGTRVVGEVVTAEAGRVKLKVGNQELTGQSFRWLELGRVASSATPEDLVHLRRTKDGSFFGRLVEVREGDKVLASGSDAAWQKLEDWLPGSRNQRQRIRAIEKGEQARLSTTLSDLDRERRRVERREPAGAERDQAVARIETDRRATIDALDELGIRLRAMRAELEKRSVVAETADGKRAEIPLGNVTHALRPNSLSLLDRCGVWLARAWEFVSEEPRDFIDGGIFPAIFGTVLMVILMTLVVTPIGVLAALYLREYARQGAAVRFVRIAVNNLAGVPSIVFGVFGLGFFVYGIGGAIDKLLYSDMLPSPTFGTGGILWGALTLALLTVPVVIVATEEGLGAVPRIMREGSLALGATKLETTWRVVLPAAMPGVLTGMILAIARAAGEVAPLMVVGMVRMADLPLDSTFPYLHMERKFMHLGFHIFEVGFHSPNVDAAKPLVFATAFLLVLIVTVMNFAAIWLRNHLRRRYATSAV